MKKPSVRIKEYQQQQLKEWSPKLDEVFGLNGEGAIDLLAGIKAISQILDELSEEIEMLKKGKELDKTIEE